MNRISKVLILGILPFFTLLGQNGEHSSTVTLSVGGETPTYNQFGESSGPVFAGNYEYRIMKYLALEGGFQSMLPLTTRYEVLPVFSGVNLISICSSGCVFFSQSARTMVNLVPFGAKVVLPLASDRFELFAGGGGAYAFHSDGGYRNAMLAQGNLGGRVAIDRGHRFWLGTTGRFFSNVGNSRQEWLSWSADFGIRF
jgi:hypothetical protein